MRRGAPDGLPALVGGGSEQAEVAVGAGKVVDAASHQRPLVQLSAAQRLRDQRRVRHLDELRHTTKNLYDAIEIWRADIVASTWPESTLLGWRQ